MEVYKFLQENLMW